MEGLHFKGVTIEDKEAIKPYLRKYSSFCLSAFTFASLASWELVYHYEWTIINGTLVIRFVTLEDNRVQLMQPIGEFNIDLQHKIIDYASTLDYQLKIYGVSDAFIAHNRDFVSRFEIIEHRDMDNYIYSSEDLALLKGKEYQPKRNLIHQFEKNYSWTSEPVAKENMHDCVKALNNVYNQGIEDNSFLSEELNALLFVMEHFTELEQHGLLIRINNEPVAFSIFELLTPTTCVVHFEKAMKDYKGLYQLINREAAKDFFSHGYKYINREEDLGIEGLRKAKLSYHPVSLCPAHALVFKK